MKIIKTVYLIASHILLKLFSMKNNILSNLNLIHHKRLYRIDKVFKYVINNGNKKKKCIVSKR